MLNTNREQNVLEDNAQLGEIVLAPRDSVCVECVKQDVLEEIARRWHIEMVSRLEVAAFMMTVGVTSASASL